MARKKSLREKAINEIVSKLKKINERCPTLSGSGRNLTLMYLENKLDKVYHRDSAIEAIQRVLLRKAKANVLLTGPAGCGKTAIAEGLTAVLAERTISYYETKIKAQEEFESNRDYYVEYSDDYAVSKPTLEEPDPPLLSDVILFDVSLTALTAGTKYRGEFEEKIQNLLDECKRYPNVILFIDEIHQIMSAGSGQDSDGAAQMLKPALARKDISVIGATTTEEAEFIHKDKALSRRFNEIKISPLTGSAADETANKILADYAVYHKVAVANEYASEILSKIKYFLPQTVFPDNFINIVDETLAGARFDGLTEVNMTHFNATLSRMAGVVIL